MDAAGWDARYSAKELVWGSEPNRFVAAELAGLAPGRALDVACGEGRNAIWLATRGWSATGVDFSAAGIDRARRLAADAGVGERTEFVVGDVVDGPLPAGEFDVVVLAYLQLPAAERRAALRGAARALAPGGLLLVIAHDSSNLTDGVGGPQDERVLYTPDDVLADLAGLPDLVVEKAGRVRRPVRTEDGDREAVDALVRLHRTGATVGRPHREDHHMSYGTRIMLQAPFEEAVAGVREALQQQGFGVLTEIDVTATMREKLGEQIEDYVILGACNPPLAHRALDVDRSIGLLLPCNVVVRAAAGGTMVEALDPHVMATLTGEAAIVPVADEAADRLKKALATLTP